MTVRLRVPTIFSNEASRLFNRHSNAGYNLSHVTFTAVMIVKALLV